MTLPTLHARGVRPRLGRPAGPSRDDYLFFSWEERAMTWLLLAALGGLVFELGRALL